MKTELPVILINTSRASNQIQFPIGLSVITNALMRQGIMPVVIDMVPVPESRKEDYFNSAIPDGPAIYGFGVMIGNQHLQETEKIVAKIKRKNADNIVVYGGHFPSSIPELMMQRCSCDYVIHGEGERVFAELIRSLRGEGRHPSSITGVFSKTDNGAAGDRQKRIMSLDDLSDPDFSNFDMEFYMGYLRETGQSWEIMASRGCSGDCSFCYKFMGAGMSFRKVDAVLDEIQTVTERYHLNRFYFVDENFLQVKRVFREFIQKKRSRGLNISFIAQCRIDMIDEEICRLGSDNGLTCVSMGIESVSQNTLDKISKRLSVDILEEKIALLRRFGIRPMVNFIIGFPWDNESDYRAIEEFIVRNNLQKLTRLSYLTPMPATRIFEEACRKGYIKDVFDYVTRLDNLYWQRHLNMTQLSDEVLDKYFKSITELGSRDLFELQSKAYAEKIREERFI